MIVFDDKPNKACKPCKPWKNFVAKLALEMVKSQNHPSQFATLLAIALLIMTDMRAVGRLMHNGKKRDAIKLAENLYFNDSKRSPNLCLKWSIKCLTYHPKETY